MKMKSEVMPKFFSDHEYLPTSEEKIVYLESQLAEVEDPPSRILLLDEVAFHLTVRGDLERAIGYTMEVMQIASSTKSLLWRIRSLRRCSWMYYQASDHLKALRYIDRSYKLTKTLDTSIKEELNELSAVYRLRGALLSVIRGDSDGALNMQFEALRIGKQVENKFGSAESLYKIGEVYVNQGLLSPALECFDESLQYFMEQGNLRRICSINGRIGQIYLMVGDPDTALIYLNKAVESAPDEYELVDTYRLIGMAYRDKGEYQKALEYHKKFGEFYTRDPFWYGFYLLDMERLYLTQDKCKKALKSIEAAEKIFREQGQDLMLNEVLLDKGRVFLALKDWSRAIDALKVGLDMSVQLGTVYSRKAIRMYLAQAYEGEGKLNIALENYQLYFDLEKEVLSSDVKAVIARYHMISQLRLAEKQKNKNSLQREEAEKELKALTLSSLQLQEHSSMFRELREKLMDYDRGGEEQVQLIKRVIRAIDNRVHHMEVWNTFNEQFKVFDHKYLKDLMVQYPSLSTAEIRICSLLKSGMSNKEVSTLLNVSSRTVDAHRRNIRKKMNLAKHQSLERELDKLGSVSESS